MSRCTYHLIYSGGIYKLWLYYIYIIVHLIIISCIYIIIYFYFYMLCTSNTCYLGSTWHWCFSFSFSLVKTAQRVVQIFHFNDVDTMCVDSNAMSVIHVPVIHRDVHVKHPGRSNCILVQHWYVRAIFAQFFCTKTGVGYA